MDWSGCLSVTRTPRAVQRLLAHSSAAMVGEESLVSPDTSMTSADGPSASISTRRQRRSWMPSRKVWSDKGTTAEASRA